MLPNLWSAAVLIGALGLTHCMLGNFSCFCCHLLTFFKIYFFKKNLSGTLSECQTVWIQIRTNDLGTNYLQRLSADDKLPLARKELNAQTHQTQPGPEVIKLFSCSTQLIMKFILLKNVKMPTIVGILTFISMINTTSERLKARHFLFVSFLVFFEQLRFRAQLS